MESTFRAELSGADEVPAVATSGSGEAEFESDGTSLKFELEWEELNAPAVAAHIHCGVSGANGPVGVNLLTGPSDAEGKVQGSITAPNPGNACGWTDLADVLDAMASGGAYVNVHSTAHPGGEIRGQVITD
ncbi:MAG: CHRD domain-containing protein [Actinopolymorphaceae bacterium]